MEPLSLSSLEVLIPRESIEQRVVQLGREIEADYAGSEELVMLVLLQGSIVFASDLMRQLSLPVYLECFRVASYHGGTQSSGTVDLEDSERLRHLEGKAVLVVDDILDSGRTLHRVTTLLKSPSIGAQNVRTCVLLDKDCARADVVSPDYVGFPIGDRFVVGYGLDYQGLYRNLPAICALPASS